MENIFELPSFLTVPTHGQKTPEELAEIEAYVVKTQIGEDHLTEQFSCRDSLLEFIHSEDFGERAVYHIATLGRYVDLRGVIAEIAGEWAEDNKDKFKGIVKNKRGMDKIEDVVIENMVAHLMVFVIKKYGAAMLTGILIGQYLAQNEDKLKLVPKKSEKVEDAKGS